MKSALPRLSVIIPTVDRHKSVLTLLKQLESQTFTDYEIIIVDSSESTDQELEAFIVDKNINYIRIKERSLPLARNVGGQGARGELILYLDDDIEADPDLFMRHIENFNNPKIDGVAGKVTGGYDKFKEGLVGRIRGVDAKIFRNFTGIAKCEVDHMPGGNMSVRKIVFEKTGGFDSMFRGSFDGEETDFCLRARKLGFKFVYDPSAVIKHLRLSTGGIRQKSFHNYLYWNAHNVMLFALRHCPRWAIPTVILTRLARFAVTSLVHGDLRLYLCSMLGLIRGFSSRMIRTFTYQ